jgi:hypothetical protein
MASDKRLLNPIGGQAGRGAEQQGKEKKIYAALPCLCCGAHDVAPRPRSSYSQARLGVKKMMSPYPTHAVRKSNTQSWYFNLTCYGLEPIR